MKAHAQLKRKIPMKKNVSPDTISLCLSEPIDRSDKLDNEVRGLFKRIDNNQPINLRNMYAIKNGNCPDEYTALYGSAISNHHVIFKAARYSRQVYEFTGLIQQTVL